MYAAIHISSIMSDTMGYPLVFLPYTVGEVSFLGFRQINLSIKIVLGIITKSSKQIEKET